MTASNPVTVVRPNPSSTRRSVSSTPIRSSSFSPLTHGLGVLGKDNEEGRAETGMYFVQVQAPDHIEAMQAVCPPSLVWNGKLIFLTHSFELGGDKKTKGAALTFVCPFLIM